MKAGFSPLAALLPLVLTTAVQADWSDNFDSYSPGGLNGIGGWECWDGNPAYNAFVVTSPNRSAPHSVQITPTTDITQQFSETSGTWTITAWQFIPTGSTGSQYFILLNTYTTGGPYNWSLQLHFDSNAGVVSIDDPGSASASIVYNQWVEIKVVADLTVGMQNIYYNGSFMELIPWQLTGVNELAAMDLFSDGGSNVYYDDISVTLTSALESRTWAEIKTLLD